MSQDNQAPSQIVTRRQIHDALSLGGTEQVLTDQVDAVVALIQQATNTQTFVKLADVLAAVDFHTTMMRVPGGGMEVIHPDELLRALAKLESREMSET